MIVFGICLLIIAAIVPKLAVLWGIGIIVLVARHGPRRAVAWAGCETGGCGVRRYSAALSPSQFIEVPGRVARPG